MQKLSLRIFCQKVRRVRESEWRIFWSSSVEVGVSQGTVLGRRGYQKYIVGEIYLNKYNIFFLDLKILLKYNVFYNFLNIFSEVMHSASVVDARRYQRPMQFANATNNSKANQLFACSLFAHVHAPAAHLAPCIIELSVLIH